MANSIIQTQIPFIHLDRCGIVEVNYEPISDPVKTGLDTIRDFDISRCVGFPSMHAKIHYEGSGIRSCFGWIQLITDYQTKLDNTEVVEFDVDVSQNMRKLGVPFYSYGNLPEIYDPPNNNIGNNSRLKWVADTFLTTLPHRSNKDTVGYILGFRWGYIEYAPELNLPVEIIPLQVTDATYWNEHLKLFREQFDAWNFVEA